MNSYTMQDMQERAQVSEHVAPSQVEFLDILDRARQLRAEAMRGLFEKAFGGIGTRMRTYLQKRSAYNELMNLDEHSLRDIGLTRGDIRAAVDGRFYRGANDNVESGEVVAFGREAS
ncbi:DUF1127 domain-containing protein [Oceanibacterium hippocampi]|uniref:YjiS-like domain-containing protein n=1 Tax=Oceanibacterium hippocampi TaxID=745714 RepID=A0A1Y5SC93_9PROT|nr:DUF1127 domain-containing protein [Oceanibacterium hippocampi]SLN37509.1 hypothetical protein OCH7691_01538 [Oceanibacterium hippocampi]